MMPAEARSSLMHTPKVVTPWMRPAAEAGLRSIIEAAKLYLKPLRRPLRAAIFQLLLLALGCLCAGAASNDASRSNALRQQLAAARQAYYAGLEGDRAADADSRQRFASLGREHPNYDNI